MRKAGVLVVAGCLASGGCITGFSHPLGPPSKGFIETPLLGTWECRGGDDPKPGRMTVMDFDGKQYLLEFASEGEKVSRIRAFATRLEGASFLNLREVGKGPDDEWIVLAYAFPDSNHLTFRVVDPQHFEDVIDDPASVAQRLAEQMEDPEVLLDVLTCARPGDASPEPAAEEPGTP